MKFKRIRDLRHDHDLTQAQIAEILHLNRVVYSRYELGVRQIPTDILIELAAYYKVSCDYVLGLTDTKTPYPKSAGI